MTFFKHLVKQYFKKSYVKPIFRTSPTLRIPITNTWQLASARSTINKLLGKSMGKHKIRNLVQSSKQSSNKKSKCSRLKRNVLFLAAFTSVFAIFIFYFDNVANMHRRLCEHVDRQYNFYLYGKVDYCDQMFHPETLTEPLELHVINQKDALHQLRKTIGTLSGVVSVALVGGSGVGKTLTCNILQSNFQWPSNVLFFVWSNVQSTSSQYYKILNAIKKLSRKCGDHLVIIDSIDIVSKKVVEELNEEIKEEFSESDNSVLVVFVFNLASYSDEDLKTLEDKRRKLQSLRGITSINFRSFDHFDVEQCIIYESRKLSISLNSQEISEIFEYIDASRSGCKLIHSKISTYT